MAQEEFEEGGFGAAELQRAVSPAAGAGLGVEEEVGEGERGGGAGGSGCGAAQEGADAGDEFVEGEGFDEVVVGAGFQAVDAFADGVEGGQDEDGGAVAHGAQLAADAEAVEDGHHDVEDDGVGLPGGDLGEGGEAVRGAPYVVSLDGESVFDGCPDLGVVVDDEDAPAAARAVWAVWAVCAVRGAHGAHGGTACQRLLREPLRTFLGRTGSVPP